MEIISHRKLRCTGGQCEKDREWVESLKEACRGLHASLLAKDIDVLSESMILDSCIHQ